MEFQLYGHKLNFNKSLENYNVVYKDIQQYLIKMSNEFETAFYSRFSNIDEVVNGGERFCTQYIDEVLDYALKFLNKNKVYEYDYNRFIDCYFKNGFLPIKIACNEIKEKRDCINIELEEIKEYRSERKESRSRVYGGGFGLNGAVSGILKAGALNAASGLAHSTVNLIGNAGSNIKAYTQKKDLYNDFEMLKSYHTAIKRSMYMVLWAIIKAINENTNITMEGPSTEDEEAANAIFNNIKSGFISKEDELNKLITVLQKYPYHDEAYLYLLDNYYDEKNELEQMAEYFGGFIVKEMKNELMILELSKLDYLNPDKLAIEKEKYLLWAKKYGLNTTSAEKAFLEIEQLHILKQKTEDGFVYSTEKEATSANKFINEIISKIKNTDANNVEAIQTLILECNNSTIQSKNKYIQYLQNALTEEDIRFRTIKGKLYDTREDAIIARKDALNLDTILTQTFCSKAEIEKAIADVNNIITINLKKSALEKLSLIKHYWEEQEGFFEKNVNIIYTKRKDFSCTFSEAQKLFHLAHALNIQNEAYNEWFHNMETVFLTVNGEKHPSADAADKAYYKWVSHAESYLKYLLEKTNSKKSFLTTLKNNVTGLINKNYESDYNAITENGSKQIPRFTKEDIALIENYRLKHNEEENNVKKRITELSSQLDGSSSIEKVQLDATNLYTINLYTINPTIIEKDVKQILNNINERIVVRNNISATDNINPNREIPLTDTNSEIVKDIANICQKYMSNSENSYDEDLFIMEVATELKSKLGVSTEQAVNMAQNYLLSIK